MSLKNRFKEVDPMEYDEEEELGLAETFSFGATVIAPEDVGSIFKFKPAAEEAIERVLVPIALGKARITQTVINLLAALKPGYMPYMTPESVDSGACLKDINNIVRAYKANLKLHAHSIIGITLSINDGDEYIAVRDRAIMEVC